MHREPATARIWRRLAGGQRASLRPSRLQPQVQAAGGAGLDGPRSRGAGTPRRGGAAGGVSARDGAGRCRPGGRRRRRWPRARRRGKMSAATAELDAASGGALSRAEAWPPAADITLAEGPATLRTPAMLSATARRARERAPGGSGWDGTVNPGRYSIYRPGLEHFKPLDREAAVRIGLRR